MPRDAVPPSEEQLRHYEALVREWAPRLDLVAPGDLDRFRERHIQDSLRLLPLLDRIPAGPCADVGSGAGLPGIPLAIHSHRHWRLIEPRRRRAAFLEEVVRALELDCEVVVKTAEAAAEDPRMAAAHALAVARALAEPNDAAALLQPLVKPGGVVAIFLGANAQVPAEFRLLEPGLAIFEVPPAPT